MKVTDVMSSVLVTAAPETPFKDVIEQLVHAGVSSLPVIGPDGQLLGLITEADLISKEAYDGRRHRALALLADIVSGRDHHWVTKAAGSAAADVMTRHVVCCAPEDDIRSAARLMLEHGVKRLPVVEDGKLVGIVSRHDILRIFDRDDASISAEVDTVLADTLIMPEQHHVRATVHDGVVTLHGDVRYEWDAPIITSMVRGVPGVIDVVGHLRHREPNPAPPWGPGDFPM